eukprot:TRINITY_DN1532_c0_g1_i9.p2 TRINITY_DN1532_c0_g1~~TRINITY_DN1532_c0_g1_i9.p2  ORF type:complete len:124 (+),score=7.23 TRINITY_DN1532_c0_g1_i9:489-860(+)
MEIITTKIPRKGAAAKQIFAGRHAVCRVRVRHRGASLRAPAAGGVGGAKEEPRKYRARQTAGAATLCRSSNRKSGCGWPRTAVATTLPDAGRSRASLAAPARRGRPPLTQPAPRRGSGGRVTP